MKIFFEIKCLKKKQSESKKLSKPKCGTYDFRIIREKNHTHMQHWNKSFDEYVVIKNWSEKCGCFGITLINGNYGLAMPEFGEDENNHHIFYSYEVQRRPHSDHKAKWKSLGYARPNS